MLTLADSGDLERAAKALGVRFLDAAQIAAAVPDFSSISPAEARERGVLPLREGDGSVLYLLSDPTDNALLGWLSARLDAPPRWGLAPQPVLREVLQGGAAADAARGGNGVTPRGRKAAAERRSPVVEFVDSAVIEAWRAGASDIHFETRRDGLTVKYRLDGVLVVARRWSGEQPVDEVLSRIKVLGGLDIAERRVPQDGRIAFETGDRLVDIRVSIMPNAYGEDAVLRLLDKRHLLGSAGRMTLEALGFAGEAIVRIRALATRPHGMLLVTGPTGSGKTTTLYAAISETLNGQEKVVTIEDPIEYELNGVLQIPVNDKKGLTFSRGLRSILRHDPDTIFVGEIRDPETADIAVQSALTGHLVFTTVHANNVFDVLGRFIHMRVDPFSFMSALNGVVSQRLVRCLCDACAQPDAQAAASVERLGAHLASDAQPRRPQGCARCRGTGYTGRTVVSEVLTVDDAFRELVVGRAPVTEMKAHARQFSTASMRADALRLVNCGRTGVEEVERVLAFD